MKGWSKRRLLLLAGVIYLVSLLATLPASLFVDRLNGLSPQLQLQDVRGSIWHGRVGQLIINNRPLRDVRWQFQPLGLLAGRLQLGLAYVDAKNDIEVDVALGLGNTLQLRHLSGEISPAFVQAFTSYSFPVLDGTLVFEDANLILKARRPQQLSGAIEWQAAALDMGQRINLGHLRLGMETTGEGMQIVLSEESGLLSGEARVLLTQEGRYSIEASFTPSTKGRALEAQLGLVLQKRPDGSYGRSYNGQLP